MAANGIEIYQPDAQVGELKLWRPPSQVLAEAHEAAKELQKRIAGKKKPVVFNGEQYLEFEDWQMLAHFYGYCPKIEGAKYIKLGEAHGFKASAELVNERTGAVVSRAEAMCLDDEDNWNERAKYEWRNGAKTQVDTVKVPTFQLLSMAQTRACAKVCRNKLAWVVVLAGYKPTPAEEMGQRQVEPEPSLPTELKRKAPQPVPAAEAPAPATPAARAHSESVSPAPRPEPLQPASSAMPRPAPQPPPQRGGKVISEAQARRFYAIAKGSGWKDDERRDYLMETFGISDDRLMPANRYEEACRWAQKGPRF